MQEYELDTDIIINWAVNYATYEELEKVSKALYGIYVQQRKNDYPNDHKKNRKLRKQLKKSPKALYGATIKSGLYKTR